MKPVSLRRISITSGSLILVVLYSILWVRMIISQAQRTGTDFIAFYSAGRIMLSGYPANVYVPQVQQQEEEAVLGFPILSTDLNPFVHPPFILPILAFIAQSSYIWAFHIWAALLLFLYGLSAFICLQALQLPTDRKVFYGGVLLFFPGFVSLLNGQDSALLLLGASLWLYGMLNKNDPLAGIGLALTSIRPQIALVLALPFLFNRRRVLWWFLAGAAVLAIFSIWVIGIEGTRNFVSMLQISASGEGYKINESAMVNILGSLRRIFPSIPAAVFRSAGWGIYLCAIFLMCVIWLKSKDIDEKQVGLAVIVAVAANPHLHYHDLILLLIPLVCALSLIRKRKILSDRSVSLIPLIVSWAFLLSNSLPILKYSLPYLLEVWLVFILWFPERIFFRRLRTI